MMMNARIHIHEDLRLEVTGHADMKGVSLSAKSLEAFFNSLLLESVQDMSKHSSWGVSLGLSSKDISSIGGQVDSSERHAVRELTSILGSKKCNIVVANALRLNGAMIADDGTYSDHGALTLSVGELFVQHIYDYDQGYTLGAAISSSAFMPTIGGRDGEGETLSTLGGGKVKCTTEGGTCETEQTNRDVANPQTWTQHYDIDPITPYIPIGGLPNLPKTPEGKVNWPKVNENLEKQVNTLFKDLINIFADNKVEEIPLPKTDNCQAGGAETCDVKDEDPTKKADEEKKETKKENDNKNRKDKDTKKETKPTDEKKSDGEKEGVERYNEELAKHTYLKVSKEIDNINGLSEGQKTESKALAQKEINDFVNADAKTKERIISRYNNQIQDLEQQLADQKFDKTNLGKVSGFFSKIFGTNRAEAEPITTTIGLSIGLEEGFSVLLVIGIGLYAVAKIQESINKGTILSTPIHENKGTTHSTPVHENKGDVETFPIYENQGQKLITIPEENGHFQKPDGFPIHDEDLHIIFEYQIDGKKFQDHHIISDTNKHTQNHELWEKAGMNPQSKVNKIFLPTEPEHHQTRSIHKGRHWDSISENLGGTMTRELNKGKIEKWSTDQYKEALHQILAEERQMLRSGERNLNKNNRGKK